MQQLRYYLMGETFKEIAAKEHVNPATMGKAIKKTFEKIQNFIPVIDIEFEDARRYKYTVLQTLKNDVRYYSDI